MENEYDDELELQLGSGHRSSSANSDSTRSTRVADWLGNTTQHQQNQQNNQQQITIFYNGKICVCDVTEIQARAIIRMARKEMEGKIAVEEKNNHQGNNVDLYSPTTSSLSQSRPPSPLQVINPVFSMKRSLQRFLQKRKMRMDDSSPYGWRPT